MSAPVRVLATAFLPFPAAPMDQHMVDLTSKVYTALADCIYGEPTGRAMQAIVRASAAIAMNLGKPGCEAKVIDRCVTLLELIGDAAHQEICL